jgi:hypothetical protein
MAQPQDFIRDPLQFMRDNIVLVNTMRVSDDEPAIEVRVFENPNVRIGNMPNGRVYEMGMRNNNRGRDDEYLKIYFCPYGDDEAHFITLGRDANFMFTPAMDGCTFGVGSQNGEGVVRVGHVNYALAGKKWGAQDGQERQREAQRNVLGDRLGWNAKMIQPEMYKGLQNDRSATTFGILDDDYYWSFYTLRYIQLGGQTFLHYGVHNDIFGA